VRNITYCCLARAQCRGSKFCSYGRVTKVTKEKKKVGKVRTYMRARDCFLGKKEGCVYINKGTRYRKQIGSWGR